MTQGFPRESEPFFGLLFHLLGNMPFHFAFDFIANLIRGSLLIEEIANRNDHAFLAH